MQFNFRSGAGTSPTNPGRAALISPNARRWALPVTAVVVAGGLVVGALALRDSGPREATETPSAGGVSAQPLIVPEEQAFIDRVRVSGSGEAAVVSSGVEPLIVPEEQAFIDRVRVSGSGEAAVVSSGVEALIVPEEQAFIDGVFAGMPVVDDIDWCLTHNIC